MDKQNTTLTTYPESIIKSANVLTTFIDFPEDGHISVVHVGYLAGLDGK